MGKDTPAGHRDPYTFKSAPTIPSLALINLSLQVAELVQANKSQDLMQLLWDATLGTTTLDASPATTRGATRARINDLVDATTALAFVGSQPLEDREAIRTAYREAREKLEKHIAALMRPAK